MELGRLTELKNRREVGGQAYIDEWEALVARRDFGRCLAHGDVERGKGG